MHQLDVGVFCGCRVLGLQIDPDSSCEDVSKVSGLSCNECFYPIECMYYCQSCHALRCPYCVDKLPQVWYCPFCLFEVAPHQARKTFNRCQRNCLLCPACKCNVVAKLNRETAKFDLECALCDWKYTEYCNQGEPLAAKAPESIRMANEFERLQKAYISGTESQRTSPETTGGDLLSPLQVPLRAKFAKKCRACGLECARPVPKVSSAKFEVQSMAINHVPTVQVFETAANQWQILVSNPLDQQINAQISSLRSSLIISTPDIQVGAYNGKDLWGPSFLVTRETGQSRRAFMNRLDPGHGSHWTLVEAEIDQGNDSHGTNLIYMSFTGSENRDLGMWLQIK